MTCIALARFVSRALLFGTMKKLQIDDWIMAFALSVYTTFVVSINIVANANSNLFPPGFDINSLTAKEISDREYGSKMVLVVEECQCVTIWAAKACLLIMYYRLTIALKENIVVKILAAYVAFGFVFMEIFYLGVWCRPFRNYWAVPTPNIQCNAATHHLITNAVFNISSDVAMLIMALQMLIRSRLPMRRKLILSGIFGLGIFVILAAVLNKYYSFSQPFGSLWTFWYVRESSTALLVANLPFTWTLLRRVFNLRAFDSSGSSHQLHSQRTSGVRTPAATARRESPNRARRTSERSEESDESAGSSGTATSQAHNYDSSRNPPSSKNHDVYGKADREALASDAWDFKDDAESPIRQVLMTPRRHEIPAKDPV